MRMFPILLCLMMVSLPAAASAQGVKPKPWSKGYVGKVLPEIEDAAGRGSRWLGETRAGALGQGKAKAVLVVITSLA